jgi:hypothetical protein
MGIIQLDRPRHIGRRTVDIMTYCSRGIGSGIGGIQKSGVRSAGVW